MIAPRCSVGGRRLLPVGMVGSDIRKEGSRKVSGSCVLLVVFNGLYSVIKLV